MLIARRDWSDVMASSRAAVPALLGWMYSRWYEIAWKCGLVLLAWSGADYFLQKRQMENSLKMTKQEVGREMKDAEGKPAHARGNPQAAARHAQALDDEGCAARHGRDREPAALCRGARIPPRRPCPRPW